MDFVDSPLAFLSLLPPSSAHSRPGEGLSIPCHATIRGETGNNTRQHTHARADLSSIARSNPVFRSLHSLPLVVLFFFQPYPHLSFLSDWQSRLPEGMTIDVSLLRGHALCEVSTQLEAISRVSSLSTGASRHAGDEALLQWRYFPVASLSHTPKTRFAQLFDARTRWKLIEIQPYVESLCTPGQTIEQLLLKMTRPITIMEGGHKIIVYTKR